VADLDQALYVKEAKLKKVVSQRDQDERRIAQLRNEIAAAQEKIKRRQDTHNAKMPEYKKIIEQVDAAKREITPEGLKKVYAFLEKKSAEPVTFLMEALVGLLQGKKRADTKSVESYIKQHASFMIGVNRVEFNRIKVKEISVEETLNQLTSVYNRQLNSEEFASFQPLRKLLVQMCLAALYAHDLADIDTKIANREAFIRDSQREIDKIDTLLRGIEVETLIRDDYDAYHGQQMTFFKDRLAHINEQIAINEGKLKNFDYDFFANL
jgi:cytochrome c556